MAASLRHIRHQLPVLRALGRSAAEAIRFRVAPGSSGEATAPGPEVRVELPPRDKDLVRAYVRAVGGDPSAYRGFVPPHFFCQWGLGPLSRTLHGLPYPIDRALNGGCRMEIRGEIPIDAPIVVSCRLEEIDETDSRVLLRQSLTTGPVDHPDALRVEFWPIIPKPRKPGAERKPRERPRVAEDARELGYFRLTPRDALDFAITTGDFNPIHWIPAAARAAGFRNVIMHGFGELGRAIERLNAGLWGGDWRRLKALDVRFRRPLVLPARVGVYVDPGDAAHAGGALAVGDAPGGPAYLTGTYAASVAAVDTETQA